MDIRIGNDIRLDFKIKIDNINQDKIKCIKCFLINTREPFPQYYISSSYTVKCCGKPTYNTRPHNIYFQSCAVNRLPQHCCYNTDCKQDCYKYFECEHNTEFTHYCYYKINNNNQISAFFPALCQKHCGIYKFITQITVQEDGWNRSNTHTYTFDYGYIFALKCNGGDQGSIIINLDEEQGPIQDEQYKIIYGKFGKNLNTLSEEDINNVILDGEMKMFTSNVYELKTTLTGKCIWWAIPKNQDNQITLSSCIDELGGNPTLKQINTDEYKIWYIYTSISSSTEYIVKFQKL